MKIRYQTFHLSPSSNVFTVGVRVALAFLTVAIVSGSSQAGWVITRLPMVGLGPSINNNGEIVWFTGDWRGIYSNIRGRLTYSGGQPHLANSGEVVYVDNFDLVYDLVSTTRGRLTFGGTIDVNSSFDVNSGGEVVYTKRDGGGHNQIFSTTRGQITLDATDHGSPCINDLGEIVWTQFFDGLGTRTVSNIRGMLPTNYGFSPQDLNNLGDTCHSGNLYDPINGYTFPHIFSSVYGPLIPNPNVYQWGGGMNDAGDIVWAGSDALYIGHWVGPGRPRIVTPPQTQTAEAGGSVWLTTRVEGATPLLCTWVFNGTNVIAHDTNSLLLLDNVQFSQGGSYTLSISNQYGTATSSPAFVSVIAPVPRRSVAALTLVGDLGTSLNLDYRINPGASAAWITFDTVSLTNASQWYFDLTTPLPPQKFYRAWHTNVLSSLPILDLHVVPAVTLSGTIGNPVRIDYINQFGPVGTWVTLDTVTLTSGPQLYFDISSINQPARLYRLVPQ